MLMMLILTWLS